MEEDGSVPMEVTDTRDQEGAQKGAGRLDNSRNPSQAVHPILKHGHDACMHNHHHPAHISFDEEVIQEHDKLRGTRMKIIEPKTPYARGDEWEIDEMRNEAHDFSVPLPLDELHARLEQDQEAIPSAAEHAKKAEFEEKRRRHYNEMEMVRKFMQQHENEEEEEEESGRT